MISVQFVIWDSNILPVSYMALLLVCLEAIMFWSYRSAGPPELRDWTLMAESYDNLSTSVSIVLQLFSLYWLHAAKLNLLNMDPMQVKIALVGKYTNLSDSYLSVVKVGQESTFKHIKVSFLVTNITSHTRFIIDLN